MVSVHEDLWLPSSRRCTGPELSLSPARSDKKPELAIPASPHALDVLNLNPYDPERPRSAIFSPSPLMRSFNRA